MNKVHFFKHDEGKLMTVRKGIFNNPVQDGVRFVFVKSKTPQLNTDDPVMRNMFGKERVGASNLVFGWANVTLDEENNIPEDFQDDCIPTEVLEAAAYSFALNKGYCNQEHMWGTECGYLVECMMFTKEKMAALNIPDGTVPEGLWVGFYIPDDDIYAKVLSGEYAMFSIEGYGERRMIEESCGNKPKDDC